MFELSSVLFTKRSKAVLLLWVFFMPPTLEKLKGHIALGLSVHPSVRPLQNLLRYNFDISYMDSSSKDN